MTGIRNSALALGLVAVISATTLVASPASASEASTHRTTYASSLDQAAYVQLADQRCKHGHAAHVLRHGVPLRATFGTSNTTAVRGRLRVLYVEGVGLCATLLATQRNAGKPLMRTIWIYRLGVDYAADLSYGMKTKMAGPVVIHRRAARIMASVSGPPHMWQGMNTRYYAQAKITVRY